MLNCIIHGRILKAGVLDRQKQNKPNLNYIDVYIEGDGGTHRLFKVPDIFINDFEFGRDITAVVNSYDGEREYLAFVEEVK